MDNVLMALTIAQAVVAGIPKTLQGRCIYSSDIGAQQVSVVQTGQGPQLQFKQKGGEFAFIGVLEGKTTMPLKIKLDSREAITVNPQTGSQELVDFWKECNE